MDSQESLFEKLSQIDLATQRDKPAEDPDRGPLLREESYIDNRKRELELDDFKNTVQGRKHYARCAFWLVVVWLFLVLLTVWAASIKVITPSWYPLWMPLITSFTISDSVLVTLVTTTTANILGLLIIVFQYLYPQPK